MKQHNNKFNYHKDGDIPSTNDNYIFVFGSNTKGDHSKGAAVVAKNLFNAETGAGVGLIGNSYAIPIKDYNLRTLSLDTIKNLIYSFVEFTHSNPNLKFWVTRVGCFLEGYDDYDISVHFKGCNTNCSFPEKWVTYLED